MIHGKIVGYDGHALVIVPDVPLDMKLIKKNVSTVEIRLDDGRTISVEQRKKIFATVGDIATWSGYAPEYLRQWLTWEFCKDSDCDPFSLKTVDMTTASNFITYLVNFCLYHNVPTKESLLNRTDDIDRYLYNCLAHRRCAVCNMAAEVHHVDRIGMGRDREKIVHKGLLAVALCRKHHNEAHNDEKKFFEKYHIYGIILDDYLCSLLNLPVEGENENGTSHKGRG